MNQSLIGPVRVGACACMHPTVAVLGDDKDCIGRKWEWQYVLHQNLLAIMNAMIICTINYGYYNVLL